jgi:hypothetical protein
MQSCSIPRTHQSGPLQQPGVQMEKEPNKFGVFKKGTQPSID